MFLTTTLYFIMILKILKNKMPFTFQFDRVNVPALLFTRAYSHHESMVLHLKQSPKLHEAKTD